jgi:hypothetical protein
MATSRFSHRGRLCTLGLVLLMLAGCAGKPPAPTLPPAKPTEPEPAAPVREAEKPAPPRTAKRGPIPVRPLNVKSECNFRDETGYNGIVKLRVAEAQVEVFEASINIPKHGTCRFALKDFRQVKSMPNIELNDSGSRCTVRMWEQGRQVAVAFSNCAKMCSGDAVDYLWPILADSHTGSCG